MVSGAKWRYLSTYYEVHGNFYTPILDPIKKLKATKAKKEEVPPADANSDSDRYLHNTGYLKLKCPKENGSEG
jgi:hypothetical protein